MSVLAAPLKELYLAIGKTGWRTLPCSPKGDSVPPESPVGARQSLGPEVAP